jgi:hypothetical protein
VPAGSRGETHLGRPARWIGLTLFAVSTLLLIGARCARSRFGFGGSAMNLLTVGWAVWDGRL